MDEIMLSNLTFAVLEWAGEWVLGAGAGARPNKKGI